MTNERTESEKHLKSQIEELGRRFHERIDVSMPTKLLIPGSSEIHTISLNLSEGGIFVLAANPPPLGTMCTVKLQSLNGREMLQGEVYVIWKNEDAGENSQPIGFGARFIEVTFHGRKYIGDMVKAALERESVLARLSTLQNRLDFASAIADIQHISLPEDLNSFVTDYATYGNRDPFLWNLILEGLLLTTLNSVPDELRESVIIIKLLGGMFTVLVDDVADELRDKVLLDQLLLLPFEGDMVDTSSLTGTSLDYFHFAKDVWQEIQTRLQKLPRYAEFTDVIEFDYRQVLNCMRYAVLVNTNPYRLNITEHNLYQPHNMHMMVQGTVDLMASPSFDAGESGYLREVLWNAQVMERIGNAVSTWQRKLKESDFTSSIFALAIADRVLSSDDLIDPDKEVIQRRILDAHIEDKLLEEWARRRKHISLLGTRISSVNISEFASGLDHLIRIHLASRGLK